MAAAARFLLFDPTGEAWPRVALPQVAFAGRSNVGKSSLLNALTGRPRLARVSHAPGRTRGIAIFEVEGRWGFVDLPGYGFAKVSRSERESWKALVEGYFSSCRRLRAVCLLVDVRRGPGEEERQLAEYLAGLGIPYRWVGTKADKIPAGARTESADRFRGAPWLDKGGLPMLVSTRTREGIDRLFGEIRKIFSA